MHSPEEIIGAIASLMDRGQNKAAAVRAALTMLHENQQELLVPSGTKFLFSSGVPANALGDEGDVYDNIVTGDRFSKQADGTWKFQYRAKGEAGYTPQKGKDYQDGYTPRKGVDYRDGTDGKSAYEVWLGAGNVGSVAVFLQSLRGSATATDGKDGTITHVETYDPSASDGSDGDLWQTAVSLTTERRFKKVDGVWRKYFDTTGSTAVVTPPNTAPSVLVQVAGTATAPRFTAQAADSDGVQSIFVKVYSDATATQLVTTFGPSAPGDTTYITTWSAAPAGSYYAFAVATDTKGLSTTSTPGVAFTVAAAVLAPTITSFNPVQGLNGDVVTITGTNLANVTAAAFNGTAVASGGITANTATSVTLLVPAGATTGLLSLTTAGGTVTSATSFTVSASSISDQVALFFLGDSKTFGDTLANPSTESWPAQVAALLPANYSRYYNLAKNGYQVGPASFQASVLYEQVPAAIALIKTLPTEVKKAHFFVWAGVNDGNHSRIADEVLADDKTALDQLRAACVAAGKEFIASSATLDPCGRQYASATVAEYGAFRSEFNRRFLLEYKSLGYTNIFNNASDARKINVNDTTYFNDKLHESAAGQAVNAANYAVIIQASCEGRLLTPSASIVDTTPPSTTPVIDTKLLRSAVAYQDLYNTSLDSTGRIVTSTVNPGTNPDANGFNAFAASTVGFGQTSGNVLGLVIIQCQSGQGQVIASLSRSQTNFLPDTFVVNNLAAAWHYISDNIEQVLGTGGTIDNKQNTTPAGSSDELIIQIEKYRTVFFKNGGVFVSAPQDNSSGVLWLELFLKGLGSLASNMTIAAANPVFRTSIGSGARGTQHFADYTAGPLEPQGGWGDFGATKSLISSAGLTLDASTSYNKSKGLILPAVYGNVEATLTVKGGVNSRPLLCIHYSETKQRGICLWYAGGNGFDGGIITDDGSVLYFNSGTNTIIGSIPPPPADVYCMSLRYVGNTIEVRVWAASASRPATAQYSYELQNDEIIASGKIRAGVIDIATVVTDLTIS